MGRLKGNRWVIGALLAVAIAVASASALVFQGRDEGSTNEAASRVETSERRSTPSTSTSTPSTTTSTTTTTAPPPPPATDPPASPTPTPVGVVPPPPPPAPACDGGSSPVIGAMNADRSSAGLPGLCGNGQLASAAQSWANWMAQNQSLTHQDLGNLLAATPFSTLAENILSGSGGMSAGDMEAAWMASPPHRQNILSGAYSAAGVGIAYSSDGRMWVAVDFGG